jgi:phenylacetate-CoA ligase
MDWQFESAPPGATWPAITSSGAAAVLGILFQLESSQWLPADRLQQLQLRQLENLLRHAYATVPYYRASWAGKFDPQQPLTIERLSALPLLSRRDLQGRFEELKSAAVPAEHGGTQETRSSGSTGAPVRVLKTQLLQLLWRSFTLRDHLWHRRDLRAKLAGIRHGIPEGEFGNWGPASDGIVATGPAVALGVRSDANAQLQWLIRHEPGYLLTYPSIAAELARLSLESGARLLNLREVRTLGEQLAPEVRELCRKAWSVPVVDVYSADEVGYVALQCPENEHYHVQSEGMLVEILDESGKPCPPGAVGRVVVTPLHNFAMPLIRYELGDLAEAGEPCSCGRGLPVLRRILGRVRNMLVTVSGERYWPALGLRSIEQVAPIIQYQLAQKELDLIEARLVTAAPLPAEQEERLRQHILSRLPSGLRLEFSYRDSIPRSASGKFEDFVSELERPAA